MSDRDDRHLSDAYRAGGDSADWPAGTYGTGASPGHSGFMVPGARPPAASPVNASGPGEDGLAYEFERLRLAAPPVPFASPAAVRRRGRQRTYRQAGMASLMGATTVVVLALVGAGVVQGVRDQPVVAEDIVAEASPTSVPAAVPPEWLLSAEHLGPEWEPATQELFETIPPWFWGGFCPQPPDGGYRSLESRIDFGVVSWRRDTTPVPTRIDHVVELFESAPAAAENLQDVRRVVASCPPPPTSKDEAAPFGLEIVDEGFAGDESLLIIDESYFYDGEEVAAQPFTRPIVVVRVGAAVSTLVYGGDLDVYEIASLTATLLQ